jgi:hypothetical protein
MVRLKTRSRSYLKWSFQAPKQEVKEDRGKTLRQQQDRDHRRTKDLQPIKNTLIANGFLNKNKNKAEAKPYDLACKRTILAFSFE